jgi:hypothetical protein
VPIGRESYAWLPQSHSRFFHMRYGNICHMAPNLRTSWMAEGAVGETRVFGALRGD